MPKYFVYIPIPILTPTPKGKALDEKKNRGFQSFKRCIIKCNPGLISPKKFDLETRPSDQRINSE